MFYPSHSVITLVTAAIVFVLVVSLFNISFLAPMKSAFKDFRLSDLYYQICNVSERPESNEVFVVDVSELRNRKAIAEVITQLDSCGVKIIALDLLFENDDRFEDNIALYEAVSTVKNSMIVSGSEVRGDSVCSSFFITKDMPQGYMNTPVRLNYETLRSFSCATVNHNDTLMSLPYAIAKSYGASRRMSADKNYNINFTDVTIPIINYKNITTFKERIKNKIVILGLATSGEDTFWTPIGSLSGPVCVAHSVNTIIQAKEISDLPQWFSIVIGLIVCYLYVVWCSYIHFRLPRIKPLLLLISVSIVAVLLEYINMLLMHYCSVSVDLLYAVLGITFAGNALALYVAVLFLLRRFDLVDPQKHIYLRS